MKTFNTASEERMIYMKEKHKQTEVGGIFRDRIKQCKIGTDSEKSHSSITCSRIWYRAYYLQQCSED